MIRYLKHTEVDTKRWDDCISRSLNRRVYAYSWYLDLVCPGWDALVEDDYTDVFPLTHNRKMGIRYLFQPYFTQQLGLFSAERISGDKLGNFLHAIPPTFRFAEIQLNDQNQVATGEGILKTRVNHELSIACSYEELSGKFSQNTRRNIRKAKELKVTTSCNVSQDELISLFRANFGDREGKLQQGHYDTMKSLIVYGLEHGMGHLEGAFDKDGVLCSAAFFLFDGDHAYFLFAASGKQARENGAMFLLIDRFLKENAGNYQLLDFEGGNDANLGRFYKSFGADEVPYPAIYINRLPGPINSLLYFVRKLRQ